MSMTSEFIAKLESTAYYQLKEGTATSYSRSEGESLLPSLLSICPNGQGPKVSNVGRGALPRWGTFKGYYKKAEESQYKQGPGAYVYTSIYPIEGYPRLFYGTLGVGCDAKCAKKKPTDNGDLLLLVTNDWKQLHVSVFRGFADATRLPENLQAVVSYAREVYL